MKQSAISFFLFSILVYTVNLQSQVLVSPYFFKEFPVAAQPQEGFCVNTLVKINGGYKPIQEFVEGDTIVDRYDQQKKVVSITKKFVKRYVRLVVNDTVLYLGCDQQCCVLPEYTWKPAKDMRVGDYLLNDMSEECEVTYAQVIEKEIVLYGFTVEDHIFYIAPGDICVHNAEALVLSVSAISLGYITIAAAFSEIAHKIYQTYTHQNASVERPLYEQKKTALNNVYQELLCIKNDLMSIKALCSNGVFSFTQQFLHQNNLIDNYCKDQFFLEQEIMTLQYMLAVHCNMVVEQLHAAIEEYNAIKEHAVAARMSWHNKREQDISNFMIVELHDAETLEEHLLTNLSQKIDELKAIINYYHNCTSICLKESTNIIGFLETQTAIISQYDQQIPELKAVARHNIDVAEKFAARRGMSVVGLKNELKTVLEQAQKSNAAKVLAQAQNQLSNMVAGGPYKDPKDNEPEKEKNCAKIEIYEKNATHIFRDEIGHLSDTPANRKLLIDMVSDKNNFLGTCKFGNQWYSKTLKNGQQVWASVRNGFIRNGGLNNTVRRFSFETGLANMKG